jgi:glucose dehydrogenase/plastocyanin
MTREQAVRRKKILGLCISIAAGSLPLSGVSFADDASLVGQSRPCCAPASKNFPMVNANYGNTMYSNLDDINTYSISKLGGAWLLHVDGGVLSGNQQSTPVVVDGVMYVQSASQKISAVDARTGVVKWTYAGGGAVGLLRGVAVAQGKVFASLSGRRVVALDQATGNPLWVVTLDNAQFPGGTTPTAVVYYDGLLYVGTGGGDGAYRGRAYALNASDGSIAWTFWGVPAPGQPGSETWPADNTWQTGGAAPWMHPAVDPALNIVYWTFGNPFPVSDGSKRPGDNLYSNSIVAMDAHTGAYLWHFQTVKHDLWDYDNTMAPVLMDLQVNGKRRKAVAVAGKTGYLYVFDRVTGQPLQSVQYNAVPQEPRQNTAATQPIPTGDAFVPLCPDPNVEPALRPVPNYLVGCLFTPFWDKATIVTPGSVGGAVWSALSFDPNTGLMYFGAGLINAAWRSDAKYRPIGEYKAGRIVAMDPATNRVVWQKHTDWSLSAGNGMLTTAGGVMFIGQPDGFLVAYDISCGRELWRFQTGAGVHTAPITYSINGEQYVAVFAGGNSVPYASPPGDNLWAFKLGGTVPPAVTPTPPPTRQPITATAVAGSTVSNTVLLGRTSATSAESTVSANAMYPQNMTVPVGTTVTFVNPAGSTANHCAYSFFEHAFDTGVLLPGQQFSFAFNTPGEFFYNDCVWPEATGKIVVQ